ncbi:lamin tail domain-containing protein 2, partial [Sphaerodactylus townsendi]|uniref:lamin tail domain-containing protein 2 n=1 Tax=Sphaerodactylus townsendi TaxID=933632 RepID=UPI0020272391
DDDDDDDDVASIPHVEEVKKHVKHQHSIQFLTMEDLPVTEKKDGIFFDDKTIREAEMEDPIKEKLPVITKVSFVRMPDDFRRADSDFSDTHSITELTKKEPEDLTSLQRDSQPTTNPHILLLLLHQKDLEIKGLKNAMQGHPPDRLACILQELVRTRQKAQLKKNQTEEILRKEIEQLNSELKAVKESHMKEVQMLQEKVMRSQLHALELQDEVQIVPPKLEIECDTESSMSLDEGAQLACESFELWTETGTKLMCDKSDLKLRRIPKHTSFVDAFHKFNSTIFSDEGTDEKVLSTTESSEIKEGRRAIPGQNSFESSKTKDSQSEPSSWTILTSQRSDLISTVTDTGTECSSSLPSLMEKLEQRGFDLSYPADYWNNVQSNISLGRPSIEKTAWMPIPLKEEYKRDSTITGSLKIISIHRRGQFVRILNNLLNKEADLSGYIIQQWVGGYPVSIYRFPKGTVLPAQHHITVWAPGANLAQKQPSDTFINSQGFFRAGPECTTILCNCSGQTVSQYTAPHRVTEAAEAYSDSVDLSVDKFPLTDDKEEFLASSWPSKEEIALLEQTLQKERMNSSSRILKKRYTGRVSIDSSCSTIRNIYSKATKRINEAGSQSSILSLKVKESHSSSSDDEYLPSEIWKPIPEEPKAREFKTTLDTSLPMVALIGQKSARSKYGFKHMNYVPTTTDLHLRRYYYGS